MPKIRQNSFNLKMPEELSRIIHFNAYDNNMTKNDYICYLLEKALESEAPNE